MVNLHRASESIWARPVSETRVYVPALGRTVAALVDSGSEINLAERWVAEEAGWHMIMSPGWTLHTALSKETIYGACPNVALAVADFQTRHHLFIQQTLGYDIILGQPWRARLRYTSQWEDDGTEIGQVTSLDGVKRVRFHVVDPADPKHRVYLQHRPTEVLAALKEELGQDAEQDFRQAAS